MSIDTRVSRWAALVAIALLVGGLAACNTIEGAGEDIEAAGEAVEDTAESAAN
jgi:predicted small secreted protein